VEREASGCGEHGWHDERARKGALEGLALPPPLPLLHRCLCRCCRLLLPAALPAQCCSRAYLGCVQVKTLVPPISQSGKVAGEVTQIAASPSANQIAVGHADGTVRRLCSADRQLAFCHAAGTAALLPTCSLASAKFWCGTWPLWQHEWVAMWCSACPGPPTWCPHPPPVFTRPPACRPLFCCPLPLPQAQIRLWDLDSGDCTATFSGHRKEVSALRFSRSGALLASGSKDTDIVVWDVAAEAGLYRLRGHRGQVTDVVFVERGPGGRRLVSASKDEHVKVWDLDTQHCFQTVVGHRCGEGPGTEGTGQEGRGQGGRGQRASRFAMSACREMYACRVET